MFGKNLYSFTMILYDHTNYTLKNNIGVSFHMHILCMKILLMHIPDSHITINALNFKYQSV